nr:sigmaB outer clamp protein [Avian orthoreovirus]
MEVRMPNFHSIIEAINDSYARQPMTWNARTLWVNDEFFDPDVIKVGGAYCCAKCCGVLYYGNPANPDGAFPHHRCHQQQLPDTTPFLRFVRMGRTAEMLVDQYDLALQTIADYYEQASRNPQDIGEGAEVAPLNIESTTESIRSDRKVDPDFWQYPLERREHEVRPEIAKSVWRIIDASERSNTLPDCIVTEFYHTRHVRSQMLTTTSIFDVAATGKGTRFSPLIAPFPVRRDGNLSLSVDNYDAEMHDVWMNGFAISPLVGGVGVTAQYERGGTHNFGHPIIGGGKKAGHYRNTFMEAQRGWTRTSFTYSVGMEPAECESRMRGHAKTMLDRNIPVVFDLEDTTHYLQSSAPLQRAKAVSFIRCVW